MQKESIFMLRRDVAYLLIVCIPFNLPFLFLDMKYFMLACLHILVVAALVVLLIQIPQKKFYPNNVIIRPAGQTWHDIVTVSKVPKLHLFIKLVIAALICTVIRFLILPRQTLAIFNLILSEWSN